GRGPVIPVPTRVTRQATGGATPAMPTPTHAIRPVAGAPAPVIPIPTRAMRLGAAGPIRAAATATRATRRAAAEDPIAEPADASTLCHRRRTGLDPRLRSALPRGGLRAARGRRVAPPARAGAGALPPAALGRRPRRLPAHRRGPQPARLHGRERAQGQRRGAGARVRRRRRAGGSATPARPLRRRRAAGGLAVPRVARAARPPLPRAGAGVPASGAGEHL